MKVPSFESFLAGFSSFEIFLFGVEGIDDDEHFLKGFESPAIFVGEGRRVRGSVL